MMGHRGVSVPRLSLDPRSTIVIGAATGADICIVSCLRHRALRTERRGAKFNAFKFRLQVDDFALYAFKTTT